MSWKAERYNNKIKLQRQEVKYLNVNVETLATYHKIHKKSSNTRTHQQWRADFNPILNCYFGIWSQVIIQC